MSPTHAQHHFCALPRNFSRRSQNLAHLESSEKLRLQRDSRVPPIALEARSATACQFGLCSFRTPSEVTSWLGWLLTNIAYLKSLVPIHWDGKTDHYHEPSCLGKHFFEFYFTSIFDFIQTTSLGNTSLSTSLFSENTQLHPFRY